MPNTHGSEAGAQPRGCGGEYPGVLRTPVQTVSRVRHATSVSMHFPGLSKVRSQDFLIG
jgi:hypothetical protein